MARTRVVQLIPNLAQGGAEQMMLHLAQGLHGDGFDVRVLTFFDATGSRLERALAASGIEHLSLGKRLGFDARMYTRVHEALRKLAPDVLHTHRAIYPYALPSLLAGLRCAAVHTVHSVAQQEVTGRARRATQRVAFLAGVAPVAICDFVARSVAEVYGVPARATIPNGVPVARFAPAPGVRERWRAEHGIPEDAIVFAMVARLERPKRPDDAVAALARLRDPARRALLLVVGEGSLRELTERRAAELRIADRVRCIGGRSDIPAVLAAADAFVLASDFEGNPLSVMEGMAAGRPVVATAVGGVPELVVPGESGFLVSPSDVAGLAAAFQRLADDAALRERLGRGAHDRAVERFDVGRMVTGYERLYAELLAERATRQGLHPLAS